jgi:hypothetical protein
MKKLLNLRVFLTKILFLWEILEEFRLNLWFKAAEKAEFLSGT